MIYEVMNSINNHFVDGADYGTFQIVSDGITGSFSETYIAGMYVMIENSKINDGIYLITDVTSGKITVDTVLNAESTSDPILIFPCTPPKSFIDLATEISGYTEKVGISSEKLGDYSVSFNGEGSWENAYSSKLNTYRKIYDDRQTVLKRYNYDINTKSRW